MRGRVCVAALAAVVATLVAGPPATAEVKQYKFKYGPVTVGPYQVLQKDLTVGIPDPDIAGSVTAMDVDMVDADGSKVPISRLMLHHIVFANAGKGFSKQDRTCNNFTGWDSKTKLPALAERFYAAGEERAKMQLPEGYGYPIAADDE